MSFKKSLTLVVFTLLLSLAHNVWAASTWYVRMDGGTPAQCTGTTNAPYPGSGNNQPCALNHPVWALGAPGTTTLMAGGDTLIIDDTNHATGGQAQYEIGYGMPNTVSWSCNLSWTYNCVMSNVPSGPNAAHPTRILGINYNNGCGTKPQFWGTDGLNQIFNLSGSSNVNMECMELTDHSNCGFRVGSPVCSENWNNSELSGPWAKDGVYAQGGTNFSFVNMDVHGMANRGFLMGGINGLTFSNVNMDGNYMSNWDADVGETGNTSYNSGNIVLDNVKNRFAGCSEAYPRSSTFNTADYTNCTDQNANPPGYGDGLGTYTTGGNWVISNSEFSHNTQDGLDLLYHDATGSVTIQRSLFEGNDGNQVKVTSPATDMENSVVVANCDYLADTHKVKNTSTFVSCRAGGDAVVMTPSQGGTYSIYNSSIYAGGNSDVLVTNRVDTCNGTETYTFRNNIYQGNGNASLYLDQLSGACAVPSMNTDYSIIDNVANNTCPSGSHNLCNTNPMWMEPISLAADSNLPNVYLQSDSPSIGAGEIIAGLSALDFNGVSRGSSWNMGAIQNVGTTGSSGTSSATGTTTIRSGISFHPSGGTSTTGTTSTETSSGSGSSSSGSSSSGSSTGPSSTGSSSTGSSSPSSSGSSSSGSTSSNTGSSLTSTIHFTPSGSSSSSSSPSSSSSGTGSTTTTTTTTSTPSSGVSFTSSGSGTSSTVSTTSPSTVKINNGAITFTSN